MSCQTPLNHTVAPGLQYWQVASTLAQNLTCSPSYLRPDVGGALMPWLFVAIQVIVHLPVIVARVTRWEDVQTLAIAIAILNVAIVIQGYVATNLDPKDVLVWSPATLVIDAGAMLQLVILVRKVRPDWRAEFVACFRRNDQQDESHPLRSQEARATSCQTGVKDTCPDPRAHEVHPIFVAGVMVSSFLLFLAIVSLQIAGLAMSFKTPVKDITASWCSPMFASFAISVQNADCTFQSVTDNVHKGIGCIELEGARQKIWIKVTQITLITSLCFEAIDAVILYSVSAKRTCFTVKMKRPWCTIVVGIIMLLLILLMGSMDAYELPPGINKRTLVVVKTVSSPFLCTGELSPAGLRGQLIGWLDGLLQSWQTRYYGS